MLTPPVFAYVDPGAGSALFQILLAGFLGAVWTLKARWKSLFSGKRRKKDDPGRT